MIYVCSDRAEQWAVCVVPAARESAAATAAGSAKALLAVALVVLVSWLRPVPYARRATTAKEEVEVEVADAALHVEH
jgi:hypothetical protein